MPRYSVTVRLEKEVKLSIGARDREAAEEKAVEIVEGWSDVKSAEATSAEEE